VAGNGPYHGGTYGGPAKAFHLREQRKKIKLLFVFVEMLKE